MGKDRKDKFYIQHIVGSIETIEEFVGNVGFEDFLKDKLLQNGVIRELEIIGEAVTNLSDGFKNNLPDIPWRDIAGMRNKLIHEYFGVDLEAVWKVVEDNIVELKLILKKYV